MLIDPDLEDASIVLLGDFNPSIFNPDWFSRNGVVGPQDAQLGQVDVIHPDLAQFRISDLEFSIDRKRIQVLTRVAPLIKLLDVAMKTFTELLPHTPVAQFGINRSIHFRTGSEEVRNKIGLTLAPLGPWGEWGIEIAKGSGELRGGMTSLSMQEALKHGAFRRLITATVQPSALIPQPDGIFVGVNDHFERRDGLRDSFIVFDTLNEVFQSSLDRSESIIDRVIALKDEVNARK